MKSFICPICNKDLKHHDELCCNVRLPVPEVHPVAEFLESIPMAVRIIALALIGLGTGYGISVIGSIL